MAAWGELWNACDTDPLRPVLDRAISERWSLERFRDQLEEAAQDIPELSHLVPLPVSGTLGQRDGGTPA